MSGKDLCDCDTSISNVDQASCECAPSDETGPSARRSQPETLQLYSAEDCFCEYSMKSVSSSTTCTCSDDQNIEQAQEYGSKPGPSSSQESSALCFCGQAGSNLGVPTNSAEVSRSYTCGMLETTETSVKEQEGSTNSCICSICQNNDPQSTNEQNNFSDLQCVCGDSVIETIGESSVLCSCDVCANEQSVKQSVNAASSTCVCNQNEVQSKKSSKSPSSVCVCSLCRNESVAKQNRKTASSVCVCSLCQNEILATKSSKGTTKEIPEMQASTNTSVHCECKMCPNIASSSVKTSEKEISTARSIRICACLSCSSKIPSGVSTCVCETSEQGVSTSNPRVNKLPFGFNAEQSKQKPSVIDCICGNSEILNTLKDASTSDSCTCLPCPNQQYYTDQLRTQDAFWNSTLQQIQDHIKCLQQEKCLKEGSVNTAESSLLPYVTYQMIQLGTTKPNLDVNSMLTSKVDLLSHQVKVPDIPTLDFYAIQDNDILYMDIIRAHIKEAGVLQCNIDQLKNQARALLSTKGAVENIFETLQSSDKIVVGAKLLSDLLQRLADSKITLEKDIAEEKKRKADLKDRLATLEQEIAREKEREAELMESLNYAGANIEIANAVHDKDCPKVANQDMKSLNEAYARLQKESEDLSKEIEDFKAKYKEDKFKKVSLPEMKTASLEGPVQTNTGCRCENNKLII